MNYLKILIVSSLLFVQNSILVFLQKIIWRKKPRKVKNILVYKVGNIGDIVTAYPAIRLIRLKYPNANIDLLTSAGQKIKKYTSAASLLKSQQIIDKIISYSDGNIFPISKNICDSKYDLCFYMSDDRTHFIRELRNLLFFSTLKIKYLSGISVNTIKFFQKSYATKNPYPYENEVDRNLNATQLSTEKHFNFFYYKDNSSNEIKEQSCEINNALIIATGAKINPKKWDLNNFFEIANLWLQNKGDVVFIGNKEDDIDAKKIISKISELNNFEKNLSENKYYNFCSKTSLEDTVYLIDKGKVMIANDSGPAHLSSFTQTKVVTIQASLDFKIKWDPYLSKKFVMRSSNINNIKYTQVWDKIMEVA
tara:strand:+ start:1824 stop:2918 length:1095 start_codon:yes stop_codon:yes gene_type:complete